MKLNQSTVVVTSPSNKLFYLMLTYARWHVVIVTGVIFKFKMLFYSASEAEIY